MFEGINARVLKPAELREVAHVTRTVENMTGVKLSLRDDALFEKLEHILHGMGKKRLLRELQDLECYLYSIIPKMCQLHYNSYFALVVI